jgi:hypothetical protein
METGKKKKKGKRNSANKNCTCFTKTLPVAILALEALPVYDRGYGNSTLTAQAP